MEEVIIRTTNVSDSKRLLEIYSSYVKDTAISFETVVPSIDEFRLRIENGLIDFPWIVLERNGQILGYAYAGPHRVRRAYQWSVESTVYIAKEHQRQGYGKKLYQNLFKILMKQNIVNVFAGISLPNPGSVSLHESLGFKSIGIYRKIGFKLGQWWDVGWWQLTLQSDREPREFIQYSELES